MLVHYGLQEEINGVIIVIGKEVHCKMLFQNQYTLPGQLEELQLEMQ